MSKDIIEPIKGNLDDVVEAMTSQQYSLEKAKKGLEGQGELDFPTIHYKDNDSTVEFDFLAEIDKQTVWATQDQIATLFEVDRTVINRHLNNIFNDGELDENSTCAKIAQVQQEGSRRVRREISYYNLDAILSVGYRVSGAKATKFRQWATATLKSYLERGYAINEDVLRNSPEKLNDLARRLRALRAGEFTSYEKVRDCLKLSAEDYDSKSEQVRNFYRRYQDKFHYAISQMTSAELIHSRSDHKMHNMGLQNVSGKIPTTKEIEVGKNYLGENELYRLHLLSEQFLLWAESIALRERKLTMEELIKKVDDLLKFNDYPILDNYGSVTREIAVARAKRELELYKNRLVMEDLERRKLENNSDD